MSVARPLFLKGLTLLGVAGLTAACASPAEPSKNIQSASIKPTPQEKPCNPDEFAKAQGYPTLVPIGGREANIPGDVLIISQKLQNCQVLTPDEVPKIPPFNSQYPSQGEAPTQIPATVTPTETPVSPTPTTAPTQIPATATTVAKIEQTPVVNLENLKRYAVYTGTLGKQGEGEIVFYPLFQDQTLVAYMYKAKDGTAHSNAKKGLVSKKPGTNQFQILYDEAPRVNLSAVVANDSSVGILKSEDYPEGLNFSANPTGEEGAQALAQAWIDMVKRVSGSTYTLESALQVIETLSKAKLR